MLATLPFSLNFLHPLMMWLLLAAGGYAMFLGIKAKKVRGEVKAMRGRVTDGD